MSLSRLDPLPIDVMDLPGVTGLVGMSFCPGRWQGGFGPFASQRDLGQDFDALEKWGARTVITLLRPTELSRLGVPDLGESVQARGLTWIHAPIRDFSAPGRDFEAAWEDAGPFVREQLRRGERILIHCRAGMGRTGTVAARLRVEFGDAPDAAIEAVRRARPGSVENQEQRDYILGLENLRGIARQ